MTGQDDDRESRDGLLICVEPCGDGWSVRCASVVRDMSFLSGREAEKAAIRLGGWLSRSGRPVELHVIVRGGVLAGRFLFTPWSALYARRDVAPLGGMAAETNTPAIGAA